MNKTMELKIWRLGNPFIPIPINTNEPSYIVQDSSPHLLSQIFVFFEIRDNHGDISVKIRLLTRQSAEETARVGPLTAARLGFALSL